MSAQDWKHIYFLGIGGIGMSALARYFNNRGAHISGYDRTRTLLTRQLEEEGMKIHYQDDPDLLPEKIDIVIITPAIPAEHQEWAVLRDMGVPILKRAEVLGMLSKGHRTLAVGGTHGKTTTSTMAAWLLRSGGVDCTAFLGGISGNFNGNYLDGKGEWMVVEADEFDRSFLHLEPSVAAVLSMDPDHLDIYGQGEAVREAYLGFMDRTVEGGTLILPKVVIEDLSPEELQQLRSGSRNLESFGIGKADISGRNIRVENGMFCFEYSSPEGETTITLPMPGRHNVKNALVAIRMAQIAGVPLERIKENMALFKGIKRRFEWIFRSDERVYIDDYAHHPTELAAAINAARELFPGKKLTGIFQPHLFSRTRDFMDGFAAELEKLDSLVLLEIYPARERPIPGVSSEALFAKIRMEDKVMLKDEEVIRWLESRDIQVLMTLGAGDIDLLVPQIKRYLENAD